ncbi:hypothetical protein [uncultured Roseobacter sp.]|uniref:hypothetical protein n=1 Tax=uncultured Roseobacter sp. TaxID=114847 RepID=UPI0026374118|nr:hypothetical protein [uncultured Roseobacter sp.]
MDLIFIHGHPAVGKRTIAHRLADFLPARVLENHDSIDLAKTVLDFGAPGFWNLVGELRISLLRAAARSENAFIVTTACYVHPEDLPVLTEWESVLAKEKGSLVPVYLHCATELLFERVSAPDRLARGKLTSHEGLQSHLDRNDYCAVPRPDVISIDTGAHAPADAAELIRSQILKRASTPNGTAAGGSRILTET